MYPPKSNAYEHHSDAQPPYTGPPIFTGVPVSPPGQPAAAPHFQSQAEVPWSSGLCDCFSDVKNCCLTCWCPCVTFGQIAEIVDEGAVSGTVSALLYEVIAATTGHACLYACLYRSKMRNQYKLEERPCNDCLVHCCCHLCALCQEYRQLQNLGFKVVMGWRGNLEQRNREAAMTRTAPTVEQSMKR